MDNTLSRKSSYAIDFTGIGTLLDYRQFYNQDPPSVDDFLKDISREDVIRVITSFLCVPVYEDIYTKSCEYFSTILEKSSNEISKTVALSLRKLIRSSPQIAVFNEISALRILSRSVIVSKESWIEDKTLLMLNIFNAFLVINCETNIKVNNNYNYIKEHFPNHYREIGFLSSTLVNHEFSNVRFSTEILVQFIKSQKFLEFLESGSETKILAQSLYELYSVKSGLEYMKLFEVVLTSMWDKTTETAIDLDIDTVPLNVKNLILRFAYPLQDEGVNNDLTLQKTYPFIQKHGNIYRLIYTPFFLDRIYKGLYFEIRSIYEALDNKPVANLRQHLTYEFSERTLCTYVLKYSLAKNSILIESSELESELGGGVDYYIRENNKIYLLESKDYLFPALMKENSDFRLIKEELYKRFVFNGKKGVGIRQIVKSIYKVISKQVSFDKIPANSTIYPIIIVHDRLFDAPGMTALFDYWFNQEKKDILRQNPNMSFKIRALTLLPIDSLIYISDLLRTGTIKLNNYIEFLSKRSIKSQTNNPRINLELYLNSVKSTRAKTESYLKYYAPDYAGPFNMIQTFFPEE